MALQRIFVMKHNLLVVFMIVFFEAIDSQRLVLVFSF